MALDRNHFFRTRNEGAWRRCRRQAPERGSARRPRQAEAGGTSHRHPVRCPRGCRALPPHFSQCSLGAPVPGAGGLAAVQHLGRQNAAQAGSAGWGHLDEASGEWAPVLAGRLDAVFCAASYDGLVQRKLYVQRYNVDLLRQPWACLAAGEHQSCILLHSNYGTYLCIVVMSWNGIVRPTC